MHNNTTTTNNTKNQISMHQNCVKTTIMLKQIMTEEANATGDGVLVLDCNFEVVNLPGIKGETIREIKIDGVKHLSLAGHTTSADSNTTKALNGIAFADYCRVLVIAVVSPGETLSTLACWSIHVRHLPS